MAPSTTRAVVVEALNSIGVSTVPTPTLRDDYILVKTIAVGLNPTDWQHAYLGIGGDPSGTRAGCDYVGIVEQVGSKVTKSFQKGDRILGVAHGSNVVQPEDGAFAEYIVVKGDLQIKVPDNISDESAAALGVAVTTVGQALYQNLKLTLPNAPLETPVPILIYGGATAVGLLAIQFAHASGYTVLTTASPSHEDYLRSLGASAVFDYKSANWPSDVSAAANGQLKLVFDCIGTAETAKGVAQAMSAETANARYTTTEEPGAIFIEANRPGVGASAVLAYTALGEEFKWVDEAGRLETWEARPDDHEFAKMFWELTRGWLESGKVKAPRTTVDLGGRGFEGVLVGLEELRQGKVRGGRLVYHV